MRHMRYILILLCFATVHARAGEGRKKVAFRIFGNLGTWMSYYRQQSPGHDVKVSSLLAPAVGATMGLRIGIILAEYSGWWGFSPYSANPKARDATYFAPLGGNLGLSLPYIPIEPYVGYEWGRYGLSSGAEPVYSKSGPKFGVNVLFPFSSKGQFGLKAEYRKFSVGEDNMGPLPSNISTQIEVFSVFLTIGM